ncbi:MAG: glycosyltransferase family 4 protein [Candidatus Berkelbacteria bacterium]|nr:glycosyltransferase family 4 protein [Candidatus Berkelbacteria bacterium]
MKSILLIGWYFYPNLGGVETVMLNQARFFLKKGYKITVLTSKIEGHPDEEEFEKILILRRTYLDSSRAEEQQKVEEDLKRIIEVTKPDIIHFHNGSYPAGSTNITAGVQNAKAIFNLAKRYRIPIIDHAHNAQLKNPEATKALRELAWDYLIFVSRFVQEEWKKLGFATKRYSIVKNGIEVEKFAKAKPDQKVKRLKRGNKKIIFFPARIVKISTGELSGQKNFRLLAKACGILIKRDFKDFLILGFLDKSVKEVLKEPKLKGLADLIKENSLEKNLVFLPPASYDQMPSYYKSSDIVCVPSIKEAFSLTHIEALASGKVAIATNTGGTPELIKNGINGFMVRPDDPDGLADILSKIMKDQRLADEIKLNGLKTASLFTVERAMNQIKKIYQEVLS